MLHFVLYQSDTENPLQIHAELTKTSAKF